MTAHPQPEAAQLPHLSQTKEKRADQLYKTKNNMSTQKAKFALFSRLQDMGFTYEEAVSLRRIEMTLQRWGELECGDGNEYGSWAIERDEATGKPYMVRHHYRHGQGKDSVTRYAVADREAGAIKRLNKIVAARNEREARFLHSPETILAHHQGDCRGCNLYLLTREQLTQDGTLLPIDQYYTRGLAVCA